VDEHRERIREVRKQLAQMKKENPASRPNYSELARKSGVSRQTISTYLERSVQRSTTSKKKEDQSLSVPGRNS